MSGQLEMISFTRAGSDNRLITYIDKEKPPGTQKSRQTRKQSANHPENPHETARTDRIAFCVPRIVSKQPTENTEVNF